MLGDREAAFRKNLDQWTTWTLTAIAFTNRVGQNTVHRLEVGNLRANACDVRGSDAPRLRPHVLTITKSDSQQRANLIQREAELPCPADESKPGHIVAVVSAKPAALLPAWLRQQADPLVIADRLDIAAGPARKLAHGDVDFRHEKSVLHP